jgi:hypothetical protein
MAQAYCGSRGNNAIRRPSAVILWPSLMARSTQSVFKAEATMHMSENGKGRA